DRKPTGMAEVSMTMIDPEVYEGSDANEPTEFDIQDEMPGENSEDWDETAVRARAAEETEAYTEEVQPGQAEGPEGSTAAPERTGQVPETSVAPSAEGANGDGQPPTPAENVQVILKIRRRKFKTISFKKGEIVVTRRLFRSGDSEYLLNGKLCRLRDIQDLFMGTGLGPESYALIEQGRIGQILSSKPTDRRAIIEEAAGVTRFKTRKRLAEARLEEAKLNLARVNDIFEEVTRQMNSLKRQASKAERYGRLRDEMRAKLRLVLASKFAQLDRERAEIEGQMATIAEEMRYQSEAIQQLEAEQAERSQRGYAIEAEARQNQERASAILLETDRAEARQRHNQERCVELMERASASDQEAAATGHRLAELELERASHLQVVESAAAEVAAAQQELELCQRASAEAATALAGVEAQQEQYRGAIFDAVSQAAHLHNQVTQAEERLAALSRDVQRLKQEYAQASDQLAAAGGERGQLALSFESASQRVTALGQQIADVRQRMETQRQAEAESKRRLDGLRGEHATLQGRRASLEAVIAEHGYSTESVRRLFQSGGLQGGLAPAGVLADFLEVEDRYEHVVEDFLRDELNYIGVKSWDAADEGLRLLRSDVDGRATFLVHPNDSQARFSFAVDETAQPAPPPAPIVPLKSCIRVLNGFGKSLEVILPKLRDGYIVPDPSLGRELALENPQAFFLSQSGECFHNVTVTGGKQRAEGPLSMKRELRELMRNLAELEIALRGEEQRVATLGREISELTSLLQRLEDEKRGAEKDAMTSGHSLQQLDSETLKLQERAAVSEAELRRLAGEQAEQQSCIAVRQDEWSRLQERQRDLEAQMAAAQHSLGGLRERRDAAAQRASEQMARVATVEERRRSAEAALQRMESLLAETRGRVLNLRTQAASALAEKQQREGENQILAGQVVALATERVEAETRAAQLQAESEQVRTRLMEIDQTLRSLREVLEQSRDRRSQLSATAAKLQSDGEYMAETCLNELGITREQLCQDVVLQRVEGEQLAQEDAAYRQMRSHLETMGPVNMMALEEYKETAERHQFLETQRKDLLESIANTQNTIKEIESVSRQKFQEAFDRINENFQLTFRKLFGGGQAFMRLTDQENSLESGIDVVASPPGKRLQNVLLLSGGEKALTALALLVGIFQYQPSPFCILDEVDAPLDEANVGRFTELVKEMSVQTQFVLITHSKKTMSIAPVLYGVTMQEPGVSKLVSVRFGA
ncbi:MAG TPA: chromosome segregation protein SMC, partial [Terriglobales bacterium]|nr:chromosome segregation protein SMC [Terriglobales bacterium]